jgi:hypothetical protein
MLVSGEWVKRAEGAEELGKLRKLRKSNYFCHHAPEAGGWRTGSRLLAAFSCLLSSLLPVNWSLITDNG